MGAFWITIFILYVSAWESVCITNKGRRFGQEGSLRNFRHINGASANVNTDWEIGLREAVNQALLRERYHDYNLRDRLLEAPLLGRQDIVTPFGDIVILARGQLYVSEAGKFLFVQDQYQNDCDACHNPRPRCIKSPCQIWQPDDNERLVALWTVKRLRHRNSNQGHYYELEYIVSPITPAISEFVSRNGHFDYGIPGHIFVVKNGKEAHSRPEPTFVRNRDIPHHHYNPEILIGITKDGEKHILHSYPGFYTSFPVHPTYYQNRYSTNDPREIELYKELIESLAAKTSSTQKDETGPHRFSLNDYTESTVGKVHSTKPSYDIFPATQNSMAELPTKLLTTSTTTITNNPTYPLVQLPQTTYQHNVITKPSVTNMFPTKPTELNSKEIFSIVNTINAKNDNTPAITQPIATTIHYFTPIGEEELITDDVTEMRKITLATTTANKTPEQMPEESGIDFLFPLPQRTTVPLTTTKQPTTITQNIIDILDEPASSPTHTTKQYHTNITKATSTLSTTTETPNPYKTSTMKSTITNTTPLSTKPNPTTTRTRKTTPRIFKIPQTSKTMTNIPTRTTTTYTTKNLTYNPKTTKSIPKVTSYISKSYIPKKPVSEITPKIDIKNTTPKTTYINPDTPTMKPITLGFSTKKIKQSNLTGFITSTSATTSGNRITTYKPKPVTTVTEPRLMTKATSKLTPVATTMTAQTTLIPKSTLEQSTVSTITETTTQQQKPTINLDYNLLQDILPTESMYRTSIKSNEMENPLEYNYTKTTISYTTIKPTESSYEHFTAIKEDNEKIFTSTKTTLMYMLTPTTEIPNVTTEPIHTTLVEKGKVDVGPTTQKDKELTSQSISDMTLNENTSKSSVVPDFDHTITETSKPTAFITSKSEMFSTTNKYDNGKTRMTTNIPPITIAVKITTKTPKPTSDVTKNFLTETEEEKKPLFNKTSSANFGEDDIFGAAKSNDKPTTSSMVKKVTESEIASELFGETKPKLLKSGTVLPKGAKIIFSNFYKASSTTPLPTNTERETQTLETTSLKPLTSQSYATSISYKINKKNKYMTENTEASTLSESTTTASHSVITEVNSPDTKMKFDHLALQVINHAKSIDYLNGNNKTNKVKYKRRKTYIPKNRRINTKQNL